MSSIKDPGDHSPTPNYAKLHHDDHTKLNARPHGETPRQISTTNQLHSIILSTYTLHIQAVLANDLTHHKKTPPQQQPPSLSAMAVNIDSADSTRGPLTRWQVVTIVLPCALAWLLNGLWLLRRMQRESQHLAKGKLPLEMSPEQRWSDWTNNYKSLDAVKLERLSQVASHSDRNSQLRRDRASSSAQTASLRSPSHPI